MRIGSLFSGAGGLDMAVQAVFGGEVAWHSEIDKAASTVLAYRFPGVPNLGDITQVGWADVPAVDVLCGGFPCQDVSAAGKRAGIKDGTRSGLWAVFAEAIDALRPQWVVIENVRGLLSAAAHRTVEDAGDSLEPDTGTMGDGAGRPVLRAAGAVLGDLADLGYDAQWATVAASSVGAPHRRERVFIVAHTADHQPLLTSSDVGNRGRAGQPESLDESGAGTGDRDRAGDSSSRVPFVGRSAGNKSHNASDSSGYGWDEGRPESAGIVGGFDAAVSGDEPGVALLPTPAARDFKGSDTAGDHNRRSPGIDAITYHFPALAAGQDLPSPLRAQGKADSTGKPPESGLGSLPLLPTPASADGQRGQDFARANREGSGGDDLVTLAVKADRDSAWGKYAPAIHRWESLTRPAPAPTEPNKNSNPRLSAAFSEWLMGWPAGWVTDPDIGISRNDQLRIVGNGVCPQQAVAALRYLLTLSEVAA